MGQGDKMFASAIWSGFERIAGQSVQFIIGLILARLLTPEEYGIVGLIVVFIAISEVFVDSGFASALIQKKDRNERDISTVFFFNLLLSLFFYLILWLVSPLIANFYEIPLLSPLLRVMAVTIVLNALFTVPSTLFSIELDFKTTAKVNLFSIVISGVIAIILAFYEYGVWAIVWQGVIRSIVVVIGIWICTKWRPVFVFSKKSFKHMFNYGSKLLASSLMATFFSKLNDILIGKYIGAKELGLYSRGIQFTDFVFGIFSSIVNRIFLPSLAPIQDNLTALVHQTRKILKITGIVVIPIFLCLFILAKPIILILLTEKWIMAVPIMKIFCFARLISIFSSINVNLLYVVGRTDLVLKQEYFKISVRVVLILAALKFGIFYIALAELTATCIHFFINSYHPGKIMSFGAIKQLKALGKVFVSGILMLLPMIAMEIFLENNYLKVGLSIATGLPIYLICMRFFGITEFDEIILRIKQFVSKKNS
ncbi:MAG: lipopolysaccharide biosynthesis protein [Flavobacteriaceae bacterium]